MFSTVTTVTATGIWWRSPDLVHTACGVESSNELGSYR